MGFWKKKIAIQKIKNFLSLEKIKTSTKTVLVKCTTKHTVSKKHKIFFIKYTKFVKQNCITNCKLSSLTYYLTHIASATQPSTKFNKLK